MVVVGCGERVKSNSSQLTRHMRPSAKEPVRAPLCPQPPRPPRFHAAIDSRPWTGSKERAGGFMGAASGPGVAGWD
ncbi:unnamed protein product [Pleuronectes platessa]|uniref:Uncharacterized protein n=1 Tax=Pleuronectes platessa TaxID=8262 RepID=A0A9N7VWZ8_PLEPL|nr:unnamed protein product [Pleuronectes platessa]